MTTKQQHGGSGASAEGAMKEPSLAMQARALLTAHDHGTLCTVSRRHAGFPFGSLMPYALDRSGRPLLLVSAMAMHTQNLKADARASLFIAERGDDTGLLGARRVTLLGRVEASPQADMAEVRERYLAAHPAGSQWIDFSDFAMYRLTPIEIYYVGGFGVMGWVPAEEYTQAIADRK